MQGDVINDIIEKAAHADGILLGLRVYFADVTLEIKAFIERAGMGCFSKCGEIYHPLLE